MSDAPPRRAVVVMAKQPAPGSTKTRLVPRLTPEAAADLYQCFLLDALDLARSLDDTTPVVATFPAGSADYFARVAPGFEQIAQCGDSLGERLEHVLVACLGREFDHVIAINSDSPTLPTSHVGEAFARLADEAVDIVLGPSDDGGYYLIGAKRPHPGLARDVAMSTPRVLDDTLAHARAAGLRVSLVGGWYDVDEPADLDRARADLEAHPERGRHTRRFLAARSEAAEERGAPDQSAPDPRLGTLTIAAIVPALNEAGNIAGLVSELRQQPVDLIVVADNGSADATAATAAAAGAIVVSEPRRGYGFACGAGSREALEHGADVLVYIDADHSSRPDELTRLLEPLLADEADLVLGSRVRGQIERGAMLPHQRFGNWLSARVMRLLYRLPLSDLGPYRAIRAELLDRLEMTEMTFGWPTEMTVRSAREGARLVEVPVSWRRRREGRSKVSGTVKGSILAGYHIIRVALRHAPLRG